MKHFLLLFLFISILDRASSQKISTFAGNGAAGYNGDNIQATAASLNGSYQIIFDRNDNLFVADYANHRVRKITPAGKITTIAGNGIGGYSGDGGLATSASMYYPEGLALDSAGNLFIADNGNSVIRKVDTFGIITTIAGNGNLGFSGDGGPAINAQLFNPGGLSLDKYGNLFFADIHNNRIRKIDKNGIISTVAGNGGYYYNGDNIPATSASLYTPHSVTVDSIGNIYIPDIYNNRVRKVSSNGTITTIAGNGTGSYSGDSGLATQATLYSPTGVLIDHIGNILITDFNNNVIRKVDTSGIISTIAGTGAQGFSGDGGNAVSAVLNRPFSLVFNSSGDLYFVDRQNNRVRKITNVQTTLPVTITNFNAYLQGKGLIQTNWTGYNEINVASYKIERSANGLQFDEIGKTPAKSTLLAENKYSWVDYSPLAGTNFYRIKAIDKDGSVGYSRTVKVIIENGNSSIKVYPNPVSNKNIHLSFNNVEANTYTLSVYSLAGQRVYFRSYLHGGGSATITINGQNLANGIYYIEIKSGENNNLIPVILK
jgi:hypothetical protein